MGLKLLGNLVLDLEVISPLCRKGVINEVNDEIVIFKRLRQVFLAQVSFYENMLLAIHLHNELSFVKLNPFQN
jgi:hypothetical protein